MEDNRWIKRYIENKDYIISRRLSNKIIENKIYIPYDTLKELFSRINKELTSNAYNLIIKINGIECRVNVFIYPQGESYFSFEGLEYVINDINNRLHKKQKESNVFMDFYVGDSASNFIIESKVELEVKNHYPSFSSDNPNGDDRLGIGSDVEAVAKLIASKEIKPPLAIGVFGEWGSGKSFFMEKVHEKIYDLGQKDSEVFYDDVVHIKFNAWHYSDSNLWASVVSNISEGLNEFIKDMNSDSVENLFKDMSIMSSRLQKLQHERDELNKKVEDEKSKVDVKKTISDVKDMFKRLAGKKNSIKKLLRDFGIINSKNEVDYEEFKKNWDVLTGGFKTLKGFMKLLSNDFKKDKVEFLLRYSVVGLLVVLFWNVGDTVKEVGGMFNYFSLCIKYMIPILSITTQIPKIYNIIDLIKTVKNEKLGEDEKSLNESVHRIQKYHTEIELTESKIAYLNQKINEELSGRRTVEIIEEMVDKYHDKLGLISLIRRDFEQLSYNINAMNQNEEMREVKKIERIVLYIDDLDRCKQERVIEVLEAVHLLLAFDLFVVVVGVDVKWVSQSLSNKYEILSNPFKVDKKTISGATTCDYLEKIFQIPIFMREVSEKGRHALIDYILRENKLITLNNLSNNTWEELGGYTHEELSNKTVEEFEREGFGMVAASEDNDNSNYEKIKITSREMDFMKNISILIGDTPRTIKRFLNIYRIIRVHEEVKRDDNEDSHKPIMLLLALVVGGGIYAREIIDILECEENSDFTLKTLIQDKKLSNKMSTNKYFTYFVKEIQENQELGEIKIEKLMQNSKVIKRFSFMNL